MFILIFALLLVLPPLGAALLTGAIWTSYFLQRGPNR
jgi:hypothetical protein